jgi:pimeloyl-ACP methyl ester carboxylesterase
MSRAPQRVRASGGVRLPCVKQGNAGGTPLLFLHGFAGSWRSFDPVLDHLPGSFQAIALTQRGHAGGSQPERGYHLSDFAADVAAVLDARGLEASFLIGHSMGAAVAQRFALDHPDRTLGLVLVGASIPSGANPEMQAFFDTTVSNLTDPVDPEVVHELLRSALAQPIPAALHANLLEDAYRVPAHVWIEAFRERLATDMSDEVGRIVAPTLLVWGDRDERSSREDQQRILDAVSDSRLIVYEGAGHDLHCEEPRRFAADVASFVGDATR